MEKCKRHLEILRFYICVTQITIIWCTVPEIWSTAETFLSLKVIFCHLPFYPTNNLKNQNFERKQKKLLEMSSLYTCVPQMIILMYRSWDMERDKLILGHFLPFYPITTLKINIWNKHRKISSFYTSVP